MITTIRETLHKELDKINKTAFMAQLDIEIKPISKIENTTEEQQSCPFIKPIISQEIHTNFRLPITYLDSSTVFPLSNIVCEDLELSENKNSSSSMYEYLFKPNHQFAKEMIHKWKKQYTTNIDFINDTQNLLKNMNKYKETTNYGNDVLNYDKYISLWKDLKEDDFFLEKYGYMDWDMLKYLNESTNFLQIVSFLNIASPLTSFLIPIFFLIFPFILLKIQQIPITVETYVEILTSLAKNHFIGKALSSIQSISWDKMVYLLITFSLYVLQIYQNVNTCHRFYYNVKKINDSLINLRYQIQYSIRSMESFLSIASNYSSYEPFCQDVVKHYNYLLTMESELVYIDPFANSLSKFTEFGELLKCYYSFYSKPDYEEAIRYAAGFEGFIDNIVGVSDNLNNGIVCFGNISGDAVCDFKEQYYPPLLNDNPVKNNCSFEKNIIISAPNKAGKTTILKTTAMNIIFTQQLGCGFYESAELTPYTHIHSYLNIPDTSGRDSLFQAESRRCKDILDIINENNGTRYRHFCIFDELYSGTNPEEASKAGYAFLEYLSKYKNVNFILTTHYLSICKKYRKSESIENFKMHVQVLENGEFYYTYKMKPGISKIKGALRVLKDMGYPEDIIKTIEQA
uniref:DNA mismatch repair proteins mutS family domain-containing protein n=1 Tax=viral metagenome TaxID=1070528 RepID=A0A6C0JLJ0_9ZZZZ